MKLLYIDEPLIYSLARQAVTESSISLHHLLLPLAVPVLLPSSVHSCTQSLQSHLLFFAPLFDLIFGFPCTTLHLFLSHSLLTSATQYQH
jgi:hypothetical protein